MPTVELDIPPRTAYVRVVRLALSALARQAGLDEGQVDDLKIAVSEACANAVMANEEAGVDDPVSIVWTEEPGSLTVEISDRGRSDRLAASPFDSQDLSSRMSMSVALLQSLVDGCEFLPREGGGLSTRLMVSF
jgi:anti-sigma regulatory factor (Ser/Thr protein kinase)